MAYIYNISIKGNFWFQIKRGANQNLEINWEKSKILPPDTVVVVVVIIVVVVVVLQFSSQYAQV